MIDQCKNCDMRGDLKDCYSVECFKHEDWIVTALQARVVELEEQKERIGKAIKKAFPCLAACDERLFVHMDDYNNIVEQFNDTSQQGKE